MTKTKEFGAVLARIRKERGFASAYKFFKGVGGSKSLGVSFVSYWDIERGKKLPKSWRIKDIISALGLGMHSPEAKQLVRAYFKALAGSDELLQIITAPEAPAGDDLAATAARRVITQLSANLTLDQWKVRARDMLTNFCQSCLSETEGWLTVKELADGTGFSREAVRRSLKALAACGLAEFAGDKARGRHTGKVVQIIPMTPATAPLRAAIRGYWDKWTAGSKRVALKRSVVRLGADSLARYRQHLDKAVDLAAVYGDPAESRQNSAIYEVEAAVFKIFPR